jgi:4a-hydroxytetrahydrobiopterin dehydratase
MALLTSTELSGFLSDHPGWESDGTQLEATFTFSDFSEAMAFVTRLALLAEKAFHHPDIGIRWNRVSIALSTHDEGGLTSRDTSLATQIDRLL